MRQHFEIGKIPSNSTVTCFFLPAIAFHIYSDRWKFRKMISFSFLLWFVAFKWQPYKEPSAGN